MRVDEFTPLPTYDEYFKVFLFVKNFIFQGSSGRFSHASLQHRRAAATFWESIFRITFLEIELVQAATSFRRHLSADGAYPRVGFRLY